MGTKRNAQSAQTKTDFLAVALAATEKNVTTRKTRKSINDSMFDLLYKQKQKMTRVQLIAAISYKRYEHEVGPIDQEVAEQLSSDKEWKRINRTVKNGLDSAVCNGSTSASFCSNKTYAKYELVNEANKYYIIDKPEAAE